MPAPITTPSRAFSVTFDYRCPFARNAHEHLLTAIEDGADWEVRYVPFSLGQVHVAEGDPDIWETPDKDTGLLALQVGVTVRDRFQDAFTGVHRALFAARHDEALQLDDESVLRRVLTDHGVDADEVFGSIADGTALKTVQTEHEEVAASHTVWGVPTFIAGDEAVFVRLMHRPGSDAQVATATIERVVDLLTGWTELNEFKHTTIKR
ncbi:MAG: DsbA family oxidoreductase [Acidimicrobiales bacterium]